LARVEDGAVDARLGSGSRKIIHQRLFEVLNTCQGVKEKNNFLHLSTAVPNNHGRRVSIIHLLITHRQRQKKL
jgi:hypothetical protein